MWRASGLALVLLLAAGCAAAPAPRSPPSATATARKWDGGGGFARAKNRGEAIADFALEWRGVRYRYGGATPDGFDCSGLVFFAHRKFGLTVPRTSRDQAEQADGVKERKLRRGDLVFFRVGSRHIDHVGIYIGKHRFVHAPGAGKPVTVNSLRDEFYAERFAGGGRFWDRPRE